MVIARPQPRIPGVGIKQYDHSLNDHDHHLAGLSLPSLELQDNSWIIKSEAT